MDRGAGHVPYLHRTHGRGIILCLTGCDGSHSTPAIVDRDIVPMTKKTGLLLIDLWTHE